MEVGTFLVLRIDPQGGLGVIDVLVIGIVVAQDGPGGALAPSLVVAHDLVVAVLGLVEGLALGKGVEVVGVGELAAVDEERGLGLVGDVVDVGEGAAVHREAGVLVELDVAGEGPGADRHGRALGKDSGQLVGVALAGGEGAAADLEAGRLGVQGHVVGGAERTAFDLERGCAGAEGHSVDGAVGSAHDGASGLALILIDGAGLDKDRVADAARDVDRKVLERKAGAVGEADARDVAAVVLVRNVNLAVLDGEVGAADGVDGGAGAVGRAELVAAEVDGEVGEAADVHRARRVTKQRDGGVLRIERHGVDGVLEAQVAHAVVGGNRAGPLGREGDALGDRRAEDVGAAVSGLPVVEDRALLGGLVGLVCGLAVDDGLAGNRAAAGGVESNGMGLGRHRRPVGHEGDVARDGGVEFVGHAVERPAGEGVAVPGGFGRGLSGRLAFLYPLESGRSAAAIGIEGNRVVRSDWL